ncbi:hypothetical protein [Ideonella sp.]|uniref:hypothetical protein n=1 Tax=Ideonella sp. TaxID=1929293 RepID=UPI003BB73660
MQHPSTNEKGHPGANGAAQAMQLTGLHCDAGKQRQQELPFIKLATAQVIPLPRLLHLALASILAQPGITREGLDKKAQASNSPDAVSKLRNKLAAACGADRFDVIRTERERIELPGRRPTLRGRYRIPSEHMHLARRFLAAGAAEQPDFDMEPTL